MDALNIVYIITAAAGGLLVGLIVSLFTDEATFRQLERENELLRLRVEELEKEQADGVQVIEITDNRAQPESYFTPF